MPSGGSGHRPYQPTESRCRKCVEKPLWKRFEPADHVGSADVLRVAWRGFTQPSPLRLTCSAFDSVASDPGANRCIGPDRTEALPGRKNGVRRVRTSEANGGGNSPEGKSRVDVYQSEGHQKGVPFWCLSSALPTSLLRKTLVFLVHPRGVEPLTFGSVDPQTSPTTVAFINSCDQHPATLAPLLALDPDLARLVTGWAGLPRPIRRAVLALIETAGT